MKELYKLFEKRRENYMHILEHHKHELDTARRNQIEGAINEINVFLETLDQIISYKQQESLNHERLIQERPDILTKISMLFK